MLVISRRIGESFLIGDNIEATVVDITGDKVVLGLNAPKEVPITRTEISREDAQAAASGNINRNSYAQIYKQRFPQKPQGPETTK